MIMSAESNEWMIALCLAVALVLSTAIGFERQVKHKAAGMRTHALVGLGAALFMVISKYAFTDVVVAELVRLDPSRVAAQIVSGIGFIGAGLVFVRRNKVRGLTTAASIWLTAAVGTAAGAGQLLPAVVVTAAHFLIAYLYPWLVRSTALGKARHHLMMVTYTDGAGALRDILQVCTEQGFAVLGFRVVSSESTGNPMHRHEYSDEGDVDLIERTVETELEIEGSPATGALIGNICSLSTVLACEVDPDSEQ
jgi:putative Mg2+ transporter-C (MgtC) family protein